MDDAKGVKVLFAHDTEVGLVAAAALVNTDRPGADALGDTGALEAFVQRWGWTGSRRRDAAELAGVRALRPRLRRLWHTDEDGAVALVNAMLREARALPQLVAHGEWGYHLHATPDEAPLADRMAVEAAMAVVDVVRQGELGRLHVCAADGCDDVLVDLSKNRSRRFCSTSCANRTNVAAFRARRTAPALDVAPVGVRDPQVLALLTALTAELAGGGYTAAQTFGYSPEQLEDTGVHLLGARLAGRLVGVAGLEPQGGGTGELKRFFVSPEHRGTGVADALMAALLAHAAEQHLDVLRLETGDRQRAAITFYRRHGFTEVPRFAPCTASETSVCMAREVPTRP